MKHCAKKLLGLAFALALCLAVGGTALAETPVLAAVLAALPGQETLADEPNVTAEPGPNIIDKLATEGYQVTIPTTVTVNSGETKGELEVKAKLKQWRTLNIGIESKKNNWKLAYDDAAAGADTPKVDYTLKNENEDGGVSTRDTIWYYDEDTHEIMYATSAIENVHTATIPLSVNVTDPSQATMSGTYSDTLTFTFNITKQSVTYTINVYEQKLQLTNSGTHVQAVNVVDASGNVTDTTSEPKETYVLEYGCADAWGTPLATVVTSETWTRTRPANDGGEDERCWEDLSRTLTPKADFEANNKTQTINLNLVRKWYWLDVNGATDYTGGSNEESNGNQGGRISGCVNMQVSVDGTNWSDWFWQGRDGDDYWGQFPYGIHFKLGLHHVKNGYVYDTGTSGGVKIIANKQETETAPGEEEGDTTYYVYKGTLTGEPTGKDSYNNVRYCYIPCYKKGITYFTNGGTGGKEDVNEANLPRTNVPYNTTDALGSPDQLLIDPPTGMTFAGWSTKPNYTTGTTLYTAEQTMGGVTWDTYTAAEMNTRPKNDTDKRVLYAIWKYPCTVKVQFGGVIGWTTWDAATQSFPENKQGGDGFDEPAVELGTTAYAYRNASLTLSATENTEVWEALQNKIKTETQSIAGTTPPEDVWQLKNEYTFNSTSPEFTIQIKRKRYLLNVIPALDNGDGTYTVADNIETAKQYGKFNLYSCGKPQTLEGKISYYQWMRNYGGSYRICDVVPNTGYQFVGLMRPAGVGLTSTGEEGTLTGKNSGIHYFGDTLGNTYTGDTIYVMYKKDMVTFDFNGGKNYEGETQTKEQYFPASYIQKMFLRKDGSTSGFIGWSLNKAETPGETIYKPDSTPLGNIPWPDSKNKVLYARWSDSTVSCNIKIQFEDANGYTDSSATVHEGGIMTDTKYSVTLTNQKVVPGGSWTLDLSDPAVPATVKDAIKKATDDAKSAANDTDTTTTADNFKYKVWKLSDKFVKQGDCTIEVPSNVAAGDTLTLKIKRRRYLLSVLSTDADTGAIAGLVTNDTIKYGTFNVAVNSKPVATEKSFYQCGWNYGASYTVSNVKAHTGFKSMDMLILRSLKNGEDVTAYDSNLIVNLKGTAPSYSSYVTEKQEDIHYYKTDGSVLLNSGGDPVRVIFYNTTATATRPSHAPAKKKVLTVHYHANFDPMEELALDLDPNPLLDDMDEDFGFEPDPLPEDVLDPTVEAVKTVTYQPDENVVLRHCMFKRGGYVFVGWNTEPDGTGKMYEVNGVPITDWAAGATVDLYAQWKKPEHLKPVVDGEPQPGGTTPAPTPQPGGADATPAPQPGGADDAFGIDPQSGGMDDAFGVDPAAQPEAQDDAFGVDPQPGGMDDAFGIDPQPEALDDAFGV